MIQSISDLLLKAQVDHSICLVQNQYLTPWRRNRVEDPDFQGKKCYKLEGFK